jgi:hypothetical protein
MTSLKIKAIVLLSTLTVGFVFASLFSPRSKTLFERLVPFHVSEGHVKTKVGQRVRNLCGSKQRDGVFLDYIAHDSEIYYLVVAFDDAKNSPIQVDRYEERVCLVEINP